MPDKTEREQQAERLRQFADLLSAVRKANRDFGGWFPVYMALETADDLDTAIRYYARGALGVEIGTEVNDD